MLFRSHDPTGAGDSFAGGFMGYLSSLPPSKEPISPKHLRRAMIYGSVMGSFTCEQFGLERLRHLKRDEIDARFREFQELTQFE